MRLTSIIIGIILLILSSILIVLPFIYNPLSKDLVLSIILAFIGILLALVSFGFIFTSLTKK